MTDWSRHFEDPITLPMAGRYQRSEVSVTAPGAHIGWIFGTSKD
jgi:hypothetical protein